jgi:Tol biopolymer transport system component
MAAESVDAGGEGVVAQPYSLWFVDVRSAATTRITPAEFLGGTGQPRWSPDGTRLTYGGNRLIDDSGTILLQLEADTSWADWPWSPSGQELVLVAGSMIEILDLASGERRSVTGAGQATHIAWSPDGSHLAFTTSSGGAWRIRVVDARSGETIGRGPRYSQFPAWQPVLSHDLD